MKITKVSAYRAIGFNHPYEAFANFKFGINIEAEVDEEEDACRAIFDLHRHADANLQALKSAKLQEIEMEQRPVSKNERLLGEAEEAIYADKLRRAIEDDIPF